MGERMPRGLHCAADGCMLPVMARGWCNKHYARWWRLGTAELAFRSPKTCRAPCCNHRVKAHGLCPKHHYRWRTHGSFAKPPGKARAWHGTITRYNKGCRCVECVAVHERTRIVRRLKRYTLTPATFHAMVAAQGGACQICGLVPDNPEELQVDHDHRCCDTDKRSCGQCVRGLLCGSCNRLLGQLGDSVDLLPSVVAYLERMNDPQLAGDCRQVP